MPLIRIDTINKDTYLGLWQMTESLIDLPKPYGVDISDIHSEARRKERLTEYCLLKAMTGRSDSLITHENSGKPIVSGFEISISHTKGWAAMMISKSCKVGVDIEYISDRINKIADRFIRPDEQNDDVDYRLINWCAKESVYKLLSEEDLQYFEMRLQPFKTSGKGKVVVEDLKQKTKYDVSYVLTNDYVLTFATSSMQT